MWLLSSIIIKSSNWKPPIISFPGSTKFVLSGNPLYTQNFIQAAENSTTHWCTFVTTYIWQLNFMVEIGNNTQAHYIHRIRISALLRKGHLWVVSFTFCSNSSSITFWTSQFGSSSRSGICSSNWNGSWTDKQSSRFSTAKEMSVKATFFFM